MADYVYVARHSHKHGEDIRVFRDSRSVALWRDQIGYEYWDEVSSDPRPEDDIGNAYFDLQMDLFQSVGEFFLVDRVEVEG